MFAESSVRKIAYRPYLELSFPNLRVGYYTVVEISEKRMKLCVSAIKWEEEIM
jgi:hypothetical protein